VGLGGYDLSGNDPAAGDPSIAEATDVVAAALEAGTNWLDTSERYYDTRNESVIGEVLQSMNAEIMVATKLFPAPGGTGFRREQVHAGCRASLKRLRRERIDIYFLHRPDLNGVPLDETWGAMTELVEEGLVQAIGLSNYAIEDVERCHTQRRVDVVQDGLSLIDYLTHREQFARCGELGIEVVVFEAIAAGILAWKSLTQVREVWQEYAAWPFYDKAAEHLSLSAEMPARAEIEHGHRKQLYQRLLAPGKAERSFAVVDGMRPIAERIGISVAQLALAWVLHQDGVTAALAGSRRPANVRQNGRAADVHLAPDEVAELNALIPFGPTAGNSTPGRP
jgi:aryl-alcohol dehydrogenase-like predicted oxidoreductase